MSKLFMIAFIALFFVPIRFSVAVYFSLDRELVLVSIRLFGINALRVHLQTKDEKWIATINGKQPKLKVKKQTQQTLRVKIQPNRRVKKQSQPNLKVKEQSVKKLIKSFIKSADLQHIECALQFGTDDAKTTALLGGSIRGLFLPLKTKCETANLYLFSDWEKEVCNLGARIDAGIIPLQIVSEM